MKPEYCPNCEYEIVRGAQIYVCEVCGRECCTNCTDSTKEFTVICEYCEAARKALPVDDLPQLRRDAQEKTV